MAPEVIESTNTNGYDFKADIWSFGITAIELAKGAPPLIEYPPMKIILLVKNSDPPQLQKDEPFDSSFKEIVNLCLQKDPSKRPTAEVLLKKKFFHRARGTEYILANLIPEIPPVDQMINPPRLISMGLMRERINSELDS
jgi:Serine/threonine protein kinase